jgi:hypothetical protein
MQVVSLSVTQVPTCLKMCFCHSYSPKRAVASTNLRCPQLSQHRHFEVLRQHQHDIICVKCSELNIISVTKPTTLLASCLHPGNCPYLSGLVPRESSHYGRLEQDCKRLRMCYTLRNQGERHMCHSPVWCEKVLMIAYQVGMKVMCHIATIKRVHTFASELTGS